MRLRSQLLVIFLVLTAAIAGVLFVEFQNQRRAAIADERTEVHRAANLTASVLDDRLVEKRTLVRQAATDPRLYPHGTATQKAALVGFLNRTDFDGVSVVAANGTMIAIRGVDADDRQAVRGVDFGDRGYVRHALDGEAFISDGFQAETDNTVVVVSAPIRSNGSVVGTLNAALHVGQQQVASLIGPIQTLRQSAEVRSNGTVVYEGLTYGGDAITARSTMATTGWTVTVRRDGAEVTRQIRELAVAQLLSGAVFISLVFSLGWWVFRVDLRQTRKLLDRFQALEARSYDSRVDLGGSEEWDKIERAVERLADTLQERESMLLVFNRLVRHNLRNSMTVVLGLAKQIEEESSDSEVTAYAREIHDEMTGLADTTRKANRTERLVTRERSGTPYGIDLAALVRRKVDLFVAEYPATSVTCETPAELTVAAEDDMADVVDELMENVVEHVGTDATAKVTVDRVGDDARLTVVDDGPGIPDDDVAVVTGEREISQVHHADGVGLWFVSWVVRRYGGSFTVENDDGTRAVVRVPVLDESE